MFGFGKPTPVSASAIAVAMHGFLEQTLQQNSYDALMQRAPSPVRLDIEGCDPDIFNREMMVFLLAAMFVGSEQLPDEAMAKVSPIFEELTFARIQDQAGRQQLGKHIEAQLLLYVPGLKKPNSEGWDLAIEYAATRLMPASLTHPRIRQGEPCLAFRTWLRNLAAQVIDAQQRMVRSVARKPIV